MKKIVRMDTLKNKLLSLFLALTIIPLAVTIIVIFFTTSNGFNKLITDQQEDMEHIIQTEFDNVALDLQRITEIYSQNLDFVQAFDERDRDTLLDLVNEIYSRLFSEHGIDVIEYGDTDGIVFLRGHEPIAYGDDKSDVNAIQYALNGESISGFEFGDTGLTVRAFSPIYFNQEVIGTLQMAVDDTFLVRMNEKLQGVTIDLYNANGSIVQSSVPENIGTELTEATVLASITEGEKVSVNNDQTMNSYLPMFDPTGDEIIGVIGVSQDISAIQETNNHIILIAVLISVAAIIIVIFVSVTFSRSIANPIRIISELMVELSKGNLRLAIPKSKRNDEIGQLTSSMQLMKDNLHDTLSQVAAASTNVASQSEEMTQSSVEVKSGSEQIAMTMQEIAVGTEKQANSATTLASTMVNFTTSIQETDIMGGQIRESSIDVLRLTDEGKQLMESSDKQMTKIDGIVQDAVSKMEVLDKQSEEISRLVEVVQGIANQTNLLALNAAIEAARAGEAGKGFAVVADEVRKLAEQVSETVTDITGFSSNIQVESSNVADSLKAGYKEVEQGTNQIKTTGETFAKISNSVSDMADNIRKVSENLSEISAGSQEMNASIEEIASVSEEAAAGVEQAAATAEQSSSSMEEVAGSSEQLAKLAEEMNELVGRFKL
ncbi:methyl-accepting chemotaxis protein [Oceanobacillus saliphilus]|uniref:methyl-accepting chemotaxis protein n=1 Tax=Oceanobacillus saliphilus TaxID=2925834 RepID=UPI00201DF451|nr:methyl-accepting chemotaxis protein [Oceanobacillus saliphilus]